MKYSKMTNLNVRRTTTLLTFILHSSIYGTFLLAEVIVIKAARHKYNMTSTICIQHDILLPAWDTFSCFMYLRANSHFICKMCAVIRTRVYCGHV